MEFEAPEIISTDQLYQGKLIDLVIDTIREQGRIHTREVVLHPGSAAIVAVDSDSSIYLIKQYRHPTRKCLLELPAGTLSPGERPEDGAARELEEECGFQAQRLDLLSEFFVSPGFLQEKMWVFLATDLIKTNARPEDDEILEVVRIPFGDALQRITSGEIQDAKTIIGLVLAAPRFGPPLMEIDYPAV
jgi:ADP-ribose diphosphatase